MSSFFVVGFFVGEIKQTENAKQESFFIVDR